MKVLAILIVIRKSNPIEVETNARLWKLCLHGIKKPTQPVYR